MPDTQLTYGETTSPARKNKYDGSIAIIGDFDPSYDGHNATNDAIRHSSAALNLKIESRWLGTQEVATPEGISRLRDFGSIWIAPAGSSPYQSTKGALSAIRTARECRIPLLGTCGGFQYVILEYARNVLGFVEAQHEGTEPHASCLFITRLACSLVGRTMTVTLQPNSLVARLYGRTTVQEEYRCNFGVNPDYVDTLRTAGLRIVGSDDEGVVRVIELSDHPFFVGTLFVPQLTSTTATPHPLVLGIIRACLQKHAV